MSNNSKRAVWLSKIINSIEVVVGRISSLIQNRGGLIPAAEADIVRALLLLEYYLNLRLVRPPLSFQ